MEISYWLSRWNKDKTGFHADKPNEHLVRNWNSIGISPQSVVFVPLCGMSLDMSWLVEQDYKVLGVEASEKACRNFFEQAGLEYETMERKEFKIFRSEEVEIWCGDFFKLNKKDLPLLFAIYDRAALVAMPPEKRVLYIKKIKELTSNKLVMMLVSFTYPQNMMPGPPFSVPGEEVEQLFGSGYSIRVLDSAEILKKAQKFQRRGLLELKEICYIIISQ